MLIILVLPVLLCGFLYSYGGADNTSLSWRRVGVPATLCITYLLQGLYLQAALIWLLFIILCIGYGESSTLREMVVDLFGTEYNNLITRAVLATFMSVLLLVILRSLIPLLLIPWYVGLTAFWKWDDRLIWKLNCEELLIGLGIGAVAVYG